MRRAVRALDAIGGQLARQNDLLERVADALAPRVPVTDPRDVVTLTGVDHLDALELSLAETYAERTERETGHRPTEDEVLSYLADEKTIDLHTRLLQREREVDQILADRQSQR